VAAGSRRGAPARTNEDRTDPPAGRLDVVATPIGNLGDLSTRAREVLAAATLVAAEDTRRTGALLSSLGLSKPLVSLHLHNENHRTEELLRRLGEGEAIALVSDAGTPLISDPGHALVTAALDAGFPVSAIPGPSAALMALTLSGLPAGRFAFEGFLPAKSAARQARLRLLAGDPRTLVLFEAPHRVVEVLDELAMIFGADRPAAVARELTKTFETVYRGTLERLAQMSREDPNFQRGELTLVIAGALETAGPDETLARRLASALENELPPSRLAAVVAQVSGVPRADIYRWITTERASHE
jgi:16S rRNA (cytidine1402-2'-O)-methyltransferase